MATAVGIVRKSTDDRREIVNQEEAIAKFMKDKGFDVLRQPIELTNRKRFNMLEVAPKELLPVLKELKPDWVVYSDFTRIGFSGPDEIGWFLTELKRLGIQAITASDGKPIDMANLVGVLQTAQQSLSSRDEIMNIRRRVTQGRQRAIKRGSLPGCRPAYGYDFMVINKLGQERYRIVYNHLEQQEGHHQSESDKKKNNMACVRYKVCPNGDREEYKDEWRWCEKNQEWAIYRNSPVQDKDDRKLLSPNPVRSLVVKEMYRLADKPHYRTPSEIAAELNHRQEYPLSGEWRAKNINHILRSPTYKGFPLGEQLNLSDKEREEIRLVSIEQWDRVNEHLNQLPGGPKRRRRKPSTSSFWAKWFLECSCGNKALTISGPTEYQKKKHSYRCLNCSSVKTAIIHDMIDTWLAGIGPELKKQLAEVSDCQVTELMRGLYDKKSGGWNKMTTLGERMRQVVISHLTGTHEQKQEQFCKYLSRVDTAACSQGLRLTMGDNGEFYVQSELCGPDMFEGVYTVVLEDDNTPMRERIAAIDKEILALFKRAADEAFIKIANEEAGKLRQEQETLKQQLHSLVPEYRAEKQRIIELVQRFKELQGELIQATDDNKAVLLSKYLERVRLHFDTQRQRCEAKLVKVEIVPKNTEIPGRVFEKEECDALFAKHDKRGRRKKTPEERQAMSARQRRFWGRPERRLEAAKRTKSKWTPERQLKHSLFNKTRPRDSNGRFLTKD